MNSAPRRPAGIAFGRFQVWPGRRDLLADGEPIKLGGRAFDALMALIEVPGAVVSRDALMARVWPNRTVEESNLAAQIFALRKALEPEHGLIRTIAGRGYQCTGETWILSAATDEAPEVATVSAAKAVQAPTNLPEQVTELIGREKELADILALLAAYGFVNLTGPDGIGKTRLALAAARQLLSEFGDGVWIAKFSAITDPDLVSTAVAAAVGLQRGAGEISPQLVSRALAHRRLLLILDTCEHVIDAAAMAGTLLQAGSDVRIIATSREPLRVAGRADLPGTAPRSARRGSRGAAAVRCSSTLGSEIRRAWRAGRTGKVRCPWNCVPPRVLRGRHGIRAAPPTRRRCFSQSMTGSWKGSRQPS